MQANARFQIWMINTNLAWHDFSFLFYVLDICHLNVENNLFLE